MNDRTQLSRIEAKLDMVLKQTATNRTDIAWLKANLKLVVGVGAALVSGVALGIINGTIKIGG